MQYCSHVFHCRFTTEAVLPEFKGSTLRGAFGHALKKTVCALRLQSCDTCLLTRTCVYYNIFETDKNTASPRTSGPPHPFVLVPPLEKTREFAKGEQFQLELRLFGPAISWLAYIVHTVIKMGRQGLGGLRKRGLGRFELLAVTSGEHTLFEQDTERLEQNHPPQNLTLTEPPDGRIEKIRVNLLSTLRLTHSNTITDQLDFHILIRACLRRISILEQSFNGEEPYLDYRGLTRRAEAVRAASRDYAWTDVIRHSARQKKYMRIGGLVGSVTYQGELNEFLPLPQYCGQVHIGKQTAFGLGKFTYRVT